MKRSRESQKCKHDDRVCPAGLAVVTIGNPLRGDDGIATAVVNHLQPQIVESFCSFDLGPFSNLLLDAISGHAAAIIIDATWDDAEPGTVRVIDLKEALFGRNPAKLSSSHGFSLLNELQLGKQLGLIPPRIVFFGIEVSHARWGDRISTELQAKMDDICRQLSELVRQILQENQACMKQPLRS